MLPDDFQADPVAVPVILPSPQLGGNGQAPLAADIAVDQRIHSQVFVCCHFCGDFLTLGQVFRPDPQDDFLPAVARQKVFFRFCQ